MTRKGRKKPARHRTAVSSWTRTTKRWSKKVKTLCLFLLGYVKEVAAALVGAAVTAAATALGAVAIGHYTNLAAPPPAMERHTPVSSSVRVETRTEVTPCDPHP
jgi:hypothetical protein